MIADNTIETRNALIAEMVVAGVTFDGTQDDRKKALTYSRAGKTWATNRKNRIDAYDRARRVRLDNAEGRALGYIR